MFSSLLLLGGAAIVAAQVPPSAVLLTTTKSGVLPVLPTATTFTGVLTNEGAIIDNGPQNPGFTGVYGNASVQQNNAGISYKATLPSVMFDPLVDTTITGSVTATVPSNGTGIQFSISFSGLPSQSSYGPFGYHIHSLPVPADGNCTSTLGHLDTTDRGEYYPCDTAHPETCQVGDLSGKHGKITANSTSFTANYSDAYISTNPDNSYYGFAGSIVIHSGNKTRLTCANFVLVSAGTSNYTNSSISSAVSSIASSVSSVAAAATAGSNATNATTTARGSQSTTAVGGVGSTGSATTAASATGGSTTGSATAASTSAVGTGSSAIKNAAGAMLGGVAFVVGAMAL